MASNTVPPESAFGYAPSLASELINDERLRPRWHVWE